MSTEHHEALKLADALDKDSLHMLSVDLAAAAMLRTQHALIVQMTEALEVSYANVEFKTEYIAGRTALAAATQYLKGPKT